MTRKIKILKITKIQTPIFITVLTGIKLHFSIDNYNKHDGKDNYKNYIFIENAYKGS